MTTDDEQPPATKKRPKRHFPLSDKARAFCVLIAAGRRGSDAYRQAYGVDKSIANIIVAKRAHRLTSDPRVIAHVAEIKKRALDAAAEQSAITKVALTREYVIERLTEVVERSLQHRPVLTKSGKPVMVETKDGTLAAAYSFDAKGANGALHLLGKEIGMFVERKEVRHGPLATMPDHELDAELAKLTREVAQLTGKPIAEVMKQSLRAELAIDVTPTELAPLPTADVLRLARADATATPGGGARELAADGTQ